MRASDQFGVDRLVDRLVDLLARAKAPFTLSLSGAWGVGKSTVADAIIKRLRDRDIRAVKIDAWTRDVAQLRRSVVIEVGAALKGGSEGDRKAVAEELDEARATRVEVQSARIEARELMPTLRQIARFWFAYGAASAIALFAWYEASALNKDSGLRPIFIALAVILTPILVTSIIFKFVTPSASRAPASEELALATKFEEIVTKRSGLFGYKGPIIVVIDNLDRVSGADALTALSQIRALVEIDESRCIFFIPIDRTRLAAHLSRELRDAQAAADYLEKFFNLDLQLAQPEPIDLHDWAFNEAGKLFEAAPEPDRRSLAEIAVSAAGRSPRSVIRILNGTFTRQEALAPTEDIGVRQLALVEGLLTIAPELADRLAAEPRSFVDLRQELGPQADSVAQAGVLNRFIAGGVEPDRTPDGAEDDNVLRSAVGFDRDRLRVFLAANTDIPLTREQLRLALTLRVDRFWKGVTEAGLLQEALETGDPAAFGMGLEGRPQEERDVVVERSVRYVERNVAFRRVAARALDAVVLHASTTPALNDRLHRAAMKVLSEAEGDLLASMTRSTVEFVFGQRHDEPGQAQVRARLVAAITDTATVLPITSLVVAARLVDDTFASSDLDVVRKRLADASLDEQAPLFEDRPSRLLAEGPVAAAMLESLGAWTPASPAQEQTVWRVERLIALSRTGWDGQEQLTALATKLIPQIPELTTNPESFGILDALTQLFGVARAASEFDQFGIQLAGRRTLGDHELFSCVLRLPLQAPALASVGAEIQAWIQAASPAQIAPLLVAARGRVTEALPSYGRVLLDLWETKGDAEFAAVAVGDDAAKLGELAAKWESLPTAVALQEAVPALDLTAAVGDRPAVEALIARIVGRVAAIPFTQFAALPPLGDWLIKHRHPRQSLVEAFEAKVRAASAAADLQAISPVAVETADLVGGRQSDRVAEALADRSVALNDGEPDEVAWLIEHLTAHDTRERLVVQLIERGLSLPPKLLAVASARAHFDSVQVFEALVQRASTEASGADAKANLDAAGSWTAPPSNANSDARASLDAATARFPELREQADGLIPPAPEGG